MLSIGLTGGIAAGKSLLAARFRELGAVLVDADRLARDVVAPGTPGLAAVVEHFGAGMLLPDGSLDRPRLGSIVFGDAGAREALNGIVHPLVRDAAREMKNHAGPGAVVVQDIPLLVETGQGSNFHLVVVVQAPEDLRIARMVRDRGMSENEARARMAAQATDAQRKAAADVVIVNDGGQEHVLAAVDELWHGRLLPFAANLAAGIPAQRGAPLPGDSGPARTARMSRAAARLAAAMGQAACGMGETAAGGHLGGPADSVIEIRLQDAVNPSTVLPVLAEAGYFPMPGEPPVLLRSADPGLDVTVLLH